MTQIPDTIPDFRTMRVSEIDRWFKAAGVEDIEAAMVKMRTYLPPELRVVLDYVPLSGCTCHHWISAIREVHGPGATKYGHYGLLRTDKIERCLTCGAERRP